MLAANVLCLKKKKKRTYCLSNANNYRGGFEAGCSKNERSRAGTVTMMQITEDTPPDMLAGAMDLTVHLPNGRTKKMSVERSTPMMDLLVQITVANQLQLSNYTLQALGMAPSSEHSDMVLPFKPNTPIGALDTQHVKVLPKGKSLPAPKYTAPGHQPFESTFRLKVHLPRNQLYVTRVSRNVLLEDIMRKVCEEKNLDPIKYEFKHPGNLDTILDPKLTLSDYQITEIYVVLKGTTNLNQAFSTADIMSLRKEEERKQMHNKTGGGVFNLIFKRGKSSMGSGSVSSENRSISPAHSDDSRSVTPPAIQPPPIVTLPKKDPPERPKPPQRKRRPAPKPPQIQVSVTSAGKELAQEPPNKKTSENGLTICHSRNSSDSSGYHEASILSDHCANASLPRSRPKSAFVGGDVSLQTTSNLSKMSVHSRSTTSLITGRRKKAAPPPPPLAISPASSVISQSEKPSPLVASQSDSTINTEPSEVTDTSLPPTTNLTPIPKPRLKGATLPLRHKSKTALTNISTTLERSKHEHTVQHTRPKLEFHIGKESAQKLERDIQPDDYTVEEMLTSLEAINAFKKGPESLVSLKEPQVYLRDSPITSSTGTSIVNLQKSLVSDLFSSGDFAASTKPPEIVAVVPKATKTETKYISNKDSFGKKRCFQIGSSILEQNFDSETSSIASRRSLQSKSPANSMASLNTSVDEIEDVDVELFTGSLSKGTTKRRPDVFNQLFGMYAYDGEDQNCKYQRNVSVGSLNSACNIPGYDGGFRMKKWNNMEALDTVSLHSGVGITNKWVAGDASDTESIASTNLTSGQIHFDSLPHESSTPVKVPLEDKCLGSTDSGIAQDTHFEKEKESDDNIRLPSPPPSPILDDNSSDLILTNREQITGVEDIVPPSPYNKEPEAVQLFPAHHIPAEALPPPPPSQPSSLNVVKKAESSKSSHLEVDVDWQYQLPSPPKGFRDASPNRFINNNETQSVSDYKDSVVTSPELFEKLKSLEDSQSETTVHSEVTSIASEEPLNTLTLEHLEKRKSLVYNRELSTSLKMTDNLESKVKSTDNFISSSVQNLHNTYEDTKHTTNVQQKQSVSSLKSSTKTKQHNTLPNFKISTYDVPKQNITVFEDDTIRSSTHASSTMMKSQYGQSMENISYSKKTSNHEEKEYKFYKPTPTQPSTLSHVERSGSFSTDRLSTKPVSRSKSSLTLNKYQVHKKEAEPMSRSNSLFDVSGLQSLEVMKLIQNKLSTPTASIENISQREKPDLPKKPAVQLEIKREISREQTISESHSPKEEPTSPQPVKKYYYRGPPAVNMTTWSERPKIPVAVKEDEDYKLGNVNVSSKLIVNTTNNNVSSNNSVEIKTNGVDRISGDRFSNNNMNGTEQITQKSGNVVIKISGVNNNNNYSNKYDNRMNVERSYHRKTFTDIKTNDHYSRSNQRPHSIAFESGVDISRVPVITSVELKKSYKDIYNNNTTITHISGNDNFNHSYQNNNKYGDTYRDKFRSTENLRNIESESQRNVVRVKSFKPPEHQPLSPTVRGFRTNSTSEANKRFSWNPPASYSTLPHKPKQEKEYYTNQNVPFSQSNLRRTESSKMIKDAQNNEIENSSSVRLMKPSTVYHRSKPDIVPATPVAPPPPQMPKVALKKVSSMELRGQNSPTDARDMLLESIRNFGGKKGLRAVKA
ncbi:uncharacterized protein LOC143192952 isoform X2 [Rhynchophorus ferrugineus]|uniref:uncharacterized protein LOC143192952 isoform X2 n=1 Tax=Rhynchophorus ferrugineus TaxID=354439 RepID=UPI003FCC3E05